MIRGAQRQLNIPLEEIFLCEDAGQDQHGHSMKRVYSCTACKKPRCQDPAQYDLFDGHTSSDGLSWSYESNGVGEPVPEPLANLTCKERMMLAVVKMADASFKAAYSSSGYMHFSNGAFLQPNDYHGLAAILIQDPAGGGLGRTRNATARLRRALTYLRDPEHGNPLVRETLSCFEREVRSPPKSPPFLVHGPT